MDERSPGLCSAKMRAFRTEVGKPGGLAGLCLGLPKALAYGLTIQRRGRWHRLDIFHLWLVRTSQVLPDFQS